MADKINYTKRQFIADVTAELKAIRKHATAEEREKLCIDLLNPRSRIAFLG